MAVKAAMDGQGKLARMIENRGIPGGSITTIFFMCNEKSSLNWNLESVGVSFKIRSERSLSHCQS